MLFNSHVFLFAFLPATCLIYFLLNRWVSGRAGLAWLVAASCFFYAWWDWRYLPLLLSSIIFNFIAGLTLQRRAGAPGSKTMLAFAVAANLGLLAYLRR